METKYKVKLGFFFFLRINHFAKMLNKLIGTKQDSSLTSE